MRIGFACILAAAAAATMSDTDVLSFLERMRTTPGQLYANIEPAEGEYLRNLIRQAKARNALEIGTSTGYSGMWIALGLRETGGRLVTLEIDKARYATATANFRATGLAPLIDARLGDALVETPKVEGPLDFVFIDAHKPDYLRYYELVLPKMRKGGVIAAHNVTSHPGPMRDFLDRIANDPRVKTEIVNPGQQGFSVSWVR